MIKVVASGYFNPLHIGHIKYLEAAKNLGDELTVIVNSDFQVGLKGSFPFMPFKDRIEIIRALRCVDFAVASIDTDRSVCKTLEMLKPDIFANGGDRGADNIPEVALCERLGIKLSDSVGGGKIQSSSGLIRKVLE